MVTPLGAVVRGLVAGVAGTAAMDTLLFARYRQGGGTTSGSTPGHLSHLDRGQEYRPPGDDVDGHAGRGHREAGTGTSGCAARSPTQVRARNGASSHLLGLMPQPSFMRAT